ncbi:hypothetical protein SB5439_04960 [Klebsiella variicola]|uniref:hypothetical protein n=1 Tax=Klebsiella variicola TaxID=244366 RepID=UPI00109C2750|nr:hypothetical protein [Klebsiella variicola]VGQ11514.1 hypothetical protein SB5439_04960 [Klebsiella variicola]
MKDISKSKVIWTMETLLEGEARTPFTAVMAPEGKNGLIRMEITLEESAVDFVLSSLNALRDSILERHKSEQRPPREIDLTGGFDFSQLGDDIPDDAKEAIAAMLDGLSGLGDKAPRVEVVSARQNPERVAELMEKARQGKGGLFQISSNEGETVEELTDAVRKDLRKRINKIMAKALTNPPEALKESIEKLINSSGIVRHAEFEEYQLHQHDDGTVCIAVDGEKQIDTLPILQSLARRFGIAVNTDTGDRRSEEDLGKEVIEFFDLIPANKSELH